MPRIIAGSAGGRALHAPAGQQTRPTTDRVREALFSSLASWLGTSDQPVAEQLAGTSFLDLFAGSGAVALEAASRGASPVTLVDDDRHAAEAIRRNISQTRLPATLHNCTVAKFLAGSGRRQPGAQRPVAGSNGASASRDDSAGGHDDGGHSGGGYDIVWLDPPYRYSAAELDKVLGQLVSDWLAPAGLIVVERAKRDPAPIWPTSVSDQWSRRYGETVLYFAQFDE